MGTMASVINKLSAMLVSHLSRPGYYGLLDFANGRGLWSSPVVPFLSIVLQLRDVSKVGWQSNASSSLQLK